MSTDAGLESGMLYIDIPSSVKKKSESAHGLDLFINAFHYFAVRVLTMTFYVAIPIAFTGQ